jgi:DNA-binding transcriptional regulator GbsR (MarR family)
MYPKEMKDNMIQALELNLGNVSLACKAMNIARQTHYQWMREDKEYRKAVKDMENAALDFAESSLLKQIAKGNPLSTIFFLKCKGKKRGYIEQNNLEIRGNMLFRADFGKSDTIHTTHQTEDDSQLDQLGE